MKKYVAFLDILGFNELVENNSANELAKIYSDCLSEAEEKALGIWEEGELSHLNYDSSKLEIMVISDSIIIWTQDDSTIAFCKLLLCVQVFMYEFILKGLPLRGAIEFGELGILDWKSKYANNQPNNIVLLGKPITEAFKSEKKQNWSGCIVSNYAIARFNEVRDPKIDVSLDLLVSGGVLSIYPVPLKSSRIENYYVIFWPKIAYADKKNSFNETTIRDSFKKHNKIFNNWEVEMKIRNTIDFWKNDKK